MIQLIPSSPAIVEATLDFGEAANYARQSWPTIAGLSKTKQFYWNGTRLHFLTESIHPQVTAAKRPKVMLLFSNPHPTSVELGLFMSEPRSRGFWEILSNYIWPTGNHEFRWDPDGLEETVSILNKGNYEGPLLFFECLYQIPSESPKDLTSLFDRDKDTFQKYLHIPGLERICSVINSYDIKVVLVFTGETYEAIVGKPGISKGAREALHSCVQESNDETSFWECLDKSGLRNKARLSGLKSECIVIKIMDTRAKNWWRPVDGKSVFSNVLDFSLRYAGKVG